MKDKRIEHLKHIGDIRSKIIAILEDDPSNVAIRAEEMVPRIVTIMKENDYEPSIMSEIYNITKNFKDVNDGLADHLDIMVKKYIALHRIAKDNLNLFCWGLSKQIKQGVNNE